ncbi:MAG: endonuclease/exonuclease/phosphatase family protein [Salaquimonas sp.]
MNKFAYGMISLGIIIAVIFGFLGFLHPAFDTFSHFRWHFGLTLLALTIFGAIAKVRRVPVIVLLFAGLAIWASNAGNRNTLDTAPIQIANAKTYRMLTFNIQFNNPEPDSALELIKKTEADILSLTETSRYWEPKLQGLIKKYPYQFHCPEWSKIGGSMIWSKFPLRAKNDYCHTYAALGMTEIQLEGKWLPIGIVHLRWPWPASGPKQIEALKPFLSSIGENGIISGDFNAATWSHAVNKFARFAGMEVATGFGGTWMLNLFPINLASMFGLPIDNVMAKGDVIVKKVETLDAAGSDHLPLLIEFAVKPS